MIKEMREWLADCQWQDVDADDIAEMEDWKIINAVSRHFDGGLTGFVRAYLPRR